MGGIAIMPRSRNSIRSHGRTNHHVVNCSLGRFGVLGLGNMVYGIVAIRLCQLECRSLAGIYVPIRSGDLRCVCGGILELSIRNPSQKHFASPLRAAFFGEFEHRLAVPLAQRLETRLPLLLSGTESQGRVVRVYMRETEDTSFLFHSKKIKQHWEPRVEYEFTTADGTAYRGETPCFSSDDVQPGQIVPVLYLSENPQTNRINLFCYMWADSLLFGAGSLGALWLTWYIFSRQILGKKRRSSKRIRFR